MRSASLMKMWITVSLLWTTWGQAATPIPEGMGGWIAYQSNEDGDWEIMVMRADGAKKRKLTDNKAQDEYPRWSPDGKWIAFVSNRDGNKNLYRVEVKSGKEERLTDHDGDDMDPDWSPDGKKLVFSSRRDGKDNLYLLDLSDKKVSRLTEHGGKNILASWSPDGKKLAFTSNRFVGWSVYLFDLESKEITKVVSGHGACRPRWSPDGQWLTLVSQQDDGKGDIFVVRPDGSEMRRVTKGSDDYDYFPSWGKDGKFVFYAETENKKNGPWDLGVANVETGEQWKLTDTPASESFPDWHPGR